jgi:uncharacterized coiled-coil protein SlyX
MSKVNIQPNDLRNLISKMKHYGASMYSISSQMNAAANSMGGTWSDPQYAMFIQNIQMMGKQLKANKESLDQQANQLTVLLKNLEKTQQDFKRMQPR